jgi:hypothetical protein
VTPRLRKLASGRRNTRQNLDDKQTTPVSDPEKILKTRGSLKPTTAVYQPRYTQPKDKIPVEPLTSHESPPKTLNPTLALPEIKNKIHLTTSGIHKGEILQ